MKSCYQKILVVSLLTLFLFGCGVDEVKYEEGFPEKDSEGLRSFMAHYLFGGSSYLLEKSKEKYILADRNENSDMNKVSYLQITERQLSDYYSPLFTDKKPSKTMNQMFEESRDLQDEITDRKESNLPTIKKENDNVITIENYNDEIEIKLSEIENRIDDTDRIIMNLIAESDNGLIIHLENYTTDKDFYLFALEALEEVDLYEENELDKAVESGDLERYYSLLEPIGESGIYAKLNNGSIVNMEEHTVHQIQQGDKRSADWNYVYLDGTKKEFTDGTQKIQTIENYLEGNDAYEAEFSFTFKKIAKEMGIKTSGTDITKINYFDENLIVLRIHYNGVIVGSAGGTNVLIDLQEEKPTAYLVDLGLK